MKRVIVLVIVSVLFVFVAGVAMAGDKKPSATKKISEIAQITCMLPNRDGDIVCHLTALDRDQGGSYKCGIVEACYEGFRDALLPHALGASSIARHHGR